MTSFQVAEVVKVDQFKYLGRTIQNNRQCTKEVEERAHAGWSGWRRVIFLVVRCKHFLYVLCVRV